MVEAAAATAVKEKLAAAMEGSAAVPAVTVATRVGGYAASR